MCELNMELSFTKKISKKTTYLVKLINNFRKEGKYFIQHAGNSYKEG